VQAAGLAADFVGDQRWRDGQDAVVRRNGHDVRDSGWHVLDLIVQNNTKETTKMLNGSYKEN
jgi:hypothetical protein